MGSTIVRDDSTWVSAAKSPAEDGTVVFGTPPRRGFLSHGESAGEKAVAPELLAPTTWAEMSTRQGRDGYVSWLA